jgi:ferredoxin
MAKAGLLRGCARFSEALRSPVQLQYRTGQRAVVPGQAAYRQFELVARHDVEHRGHLRLGQRFQLACKKILLPYHRNEIEIKSPGRGLDPEIDVGHAAGDIGSHRRMRSCRDEQVNDVIGLALRGSQVKIVLDMNDPMGASTCFACGECVQACPTGALMPARDAALPDLDRTVDSVCPYCGVGCQLAYNIKDNTILY